jgi:hypothetical protein
LIVFQENAALHSLRRADGALFVNKGFAGNATRVEAKA